MPISEITTGKQNESGTFHLTWNVSMVAIGYSVRYAVLFLFSSRSFTVGGSILQNKTIFDIGLELVDECWNTYASTA